MQGSIDFTGLLSGDIMGDGGTNVIANPEGTATDTLNKVQIDETIYSVEGGGSTNYNELLNKPQINNVELSGNKTTEDLGLFDGNYNNLSNKPTIPPAPVIMIGATTETDGSSGYVPQPLTSDVNKFLSGSGEWVEIGSSENEYKTTETIIGKWFDNSNIYRKVFDLRSSPITLGASWNNTNIDSSNINIILNVIGLNVDGTCYKIEADPTRSTHTLVGLRGSGTLSYLVLEYTKINE